MSPSGKLLIDGQWVDGTAGTFQACNPATGTLLEPVMTMASGSQVAEAVAAAEAAAAVFSNSSLAQRAAFLRECADQIMQLGTALIARVSAETGYPAARAEMERARTCNQLRLFADTIVTGDWLDARIDSALPDRSPQPRPDLRSLNQAVGPVAVFGASNFPLAFSVAGGDTAAALAAGCPVLVKGHSSHPGTSELVAQAMARAVARCGLPTGVFSLLMGSGTEVGAALVRAPAVKAVAFTGSFAGGMALVAIANARPEPIPVFAEMGSINPVVLLPEALQQNFQAIAAGFVGSMTLGTGQFCVNPGLVIAIEGEGLDRFITCAAELVGANQAGVMLNARICSTYEKGLQALVMAEGVETLSRGSSAASSEGYRAQSALLITTADNFLREPGLHEEVFGPVSLVVKCRDAREITAVLAAIKGQLTGTVHAADQELAQYPELLHVLSQKVGRMVINGFPTGVEVCNSMVHGGPFPAATDARFTSVGTAAIKRFIRPLCYQNFPEPLLPDALRDANPLGIRRLVDGILHDRAL